MVYPQDELEKFDLEDFVQTLFAGQDEDMNYEEIYEAFLQNYLNPVDLNTASRQDLRSLMILSELQISNILQYIEAYGPLYSTNELIAIPELNYEVVQKIIPFIKVNHVNPERKYNRTDNTLLVRYASILEEKKGYKKNNADSIKASHYQGDNAKIFLRFRSYQKGKFSFGVTTEKDPGETININAKKDMYGMDFNSYHLMLENIGNVKQIIVGDYRLESGEHLVFGSGFMMGKGAETINTIKKNHAGLRPYRSATEYGFFRGAALKYQFNRFSATPFLSIKQRDAQITSMPDPANANNYYCSSIKTTGLHRTDNEFATRNQLKESTYGVNVNYNSEDHRLQYGFNYAYTQFEYPLLSSEVPYKLHSFSGKENQVGSSYANYLYKNIYLFTEIGLSQSLGKAYVGGMILSLSDRFHTSLLLRMYDKNFHSFYGSSFSENQMSNENGTYWGIKWHVLPGIQLSSYLDLYKFPWLKYQTDAPSSGFETLSRLSFDYDEHFKAYFQYRLKSKYKNFNDSLNISELLPYTKANYQFKFDLTPLDFLQLKTFISWSTYYDIQKSSGFAVAQDLKFILGPVNLYYRMAIFDTEDYNNRQYIYENDLLYAFSIPALHGSGIRTYLLSRWKINDRASCWMKFSRTHYHDREQIGSGWELINDDKKSELKLQLQYKF